MSKITNGGLAQDAL